MDDPARTVGGTLGEYAYRDSGRDRPLSEVLKDIFSNVQEMLRSEIRLVRAEVREEAGKTAASAKLLGAGAVLALFAGGFLLVGLTQLLGQVMPEWAATLVMAAVLGITGFVLLSKGRERFTMPKPDKTIDNLKENVEWMKNQTKS